MPTVSSKNSFVITRVASFVLVVVATLGVLSTERARGSAAKPGSNAPFVQEDIWTAIKTDDGIIFVWNRTGLNFTLSIKGNEIRPMNDPNNIFFVVDGVVLQIQSLPISDFAPDARKNKLDDKAILLAHQSWEKKFIEDELLHSKLKLQSSGEKLANGSDALIWQYDLPENLKNRDAQKQVYLTIVAKDFVILLNSVVDATSSEATVHKLLLDTISTLKLSSERIDVKRLQEAIRKGSGPCLS